MLNNIVTFKSGYRSVKVIRNGTIRKLGYGFLFAFHGNYGSVSYHFRHRVSYWSKSEIFSYPLHSTPPVGILPYHLGQENQNGLATRW